MAKRTKKAQAKKATPKAQAKKELPSAKHIGETFGPWLITAVERGKDAKGNHRVYATAKHSETGEVVKRVISQFTSARAEQAFAPKKKARR